MVRWPILHCVFLAALLGACQRPGLRDLPQEYVNTISEIGYSPVYPPREAFLVGDVFFYAYRRNGQFDPMEGIRFRVGRSPALLEEAMTIARTPSVFTATDDQFAVDTYNQADIEATPVPRNALPSVAFPSIFAAASTAAGLGIGIPGSAGVGLRSGVSVELAFADVRHFTAGATRPAVFNRANFDRDFFACSRLNPQEGDQDGIGYGFETFAHISKIQGYDCADQGMTCGLAIVTDTFVTRYIDYRYVDASGFAVAMPPSEVAGSGTAPAVNLQITLPTPAAAGTMQASLRQCGVSKAS